MNNERDSLVRAWLAAQGQSWREAVQEATRILLKEYLKRWRHLIPVELYRLAGTLRAEVVRLSKFEGEAMLMPANAGFRIIVNASLATARYRSSVAHELAHTLFYTNEKDSTPQRLMQHTKREEYFCFDVARRLLAPQEHLQAIGALQESDPAVVFEKLTGVLLLSRPWAARLILADLGLANGIAGRWVRTASGWKQEYHSATATPSLSRRDREGLRKAAGEYLARPDRQLCNKRVIAVHEKSEEGMFLIVTTL